jgi:hypothetical protein
VILARKRFLNRLNPWMRADGGFRVIRGPAVHQPALEKGQSIRDIRLLRLLSFVVGARLGRSFRDRAIRAPTCIAGFGAYAGTMQVPPLLPGSVRARWRNLLEVGNRIHLG